MDRLLESYPSLFVSKLVESVRNGGARPRDLCLLSALLEDGYIVPSNVVEIGAGVGLYTSIIMSFLDEITRKDYTLIEPSPEKCKMLSTMFPDVELVPKALVPTKFDGVGLLRAVKRKYLSMYQVESTTPEYVDAVRASMGGDPYAGNVIVKVATPAEVIGHHCETLIIDASGAETLILEELFDANIIVPTIYMNTTGAFIPKLFNLFNDSDYEVFVVSMNGDNELEFQLLYDIDEVHYDTELHLLAKT